MINRKKIKERSNDKDVFKTLKNNVKEVKGRGKQLIKIKWRKKKRCQMNRMRKWKKTNLDDSRVKTERIKHRIRKGI